MVHVEREAFPALHIDKVSDSNWIVMPNVLPIVGRRAPTKNPGLRLNVGNRAVAGKLGGFRRETFKNISQPGTRIF